MFRVIKHFTDMKDNNYPYNVGDTYPRNGFEVLPSRIKELAGKNNRQGVPLIEEIPEVEEAPKKKTKSVEKADEE